jgi:hypothetical protein
MTDSKSSGETDSRPLSREAVGALVKRHTHDLRNFLNGLGMELTLVSESRDPAEKLAAVKRIHREMKCAESILRSFATKFVVEAKTSVSVSDIVEQWMADARTLLPECSIAWDTKTGSAVLQVEPGLLRSLLGDLLVFTARKGSGQPVNAGCSSEINRVVFSISCPTVNKDHHHSDPFDDLLWSSFQNLSARAGGLLETLTLPSADRFSCRLSFQL